MAERRIELVSRNWNNYVLPSMEHELGTWLQEVRCQGQGDTFSTRTKVVYYTAAVNALKVSVKSRRKNMKNSSVDLLPPAPIWWEDYSRRSSSSLP